LIAGCLLAVTDGLRECFLELLDIFPHLADEPILRLALSEPLNSFQAFCVSTHAPRPRTSIHPHRKACFSEPVRTC